MLLLVLFVFFVLFVVLLMLLLTVPSLSSEATSARQTKVLKKQQVLLERKISETTLCIERREGQRHRLDPREAANVLQTVGDALENALEEVKDKLDMARDFLDDERATPLSAASAVLSVERAWRACLVLLPRAAAQYDVYVCKEEDVINFVKHTDETLAMELRVNDLKEECAKKVTKSGKSAPQLFLECAQDKVRLSEPEHAVVFSARALQVHQDYIRIPAGNSLSNSLLLSLK